MLYSELEEILLCFREHNIESILLKGIDLAARVYPERSLRPMADIDLLIRNDDLVNIEKSLVPLNYLMHPAFKKNLGKPVSPYLNTVVCKKLTVPFVSLHLHWHILNNTFYPGYGYLSKLDINKIWQRAEPATLDGNKVFRMEPNHLLLHLAQHHYKHYFDRLMLLTDIDTVINKYNDIFNWQDIISDAVEFNFQRPLYYSLYFAAKALDTDISQDTISELKPLVISRLERRFVIKVLEGKQNKNYAFFMLLAMNKGIFKKIAFIFRTVFPHPKFIFQLQEVYGISSKFKYMLNHLSRIIKYVISFLIRR